MTRDELERIIWRITGRMLTGRQVDQILDAAERYALGQSAYFAAHGDNPAAQEMRRRELLDAAACGGAPDPDGAEAAA